MAVQTEGDSPYTVQATDKDNHVDVEPFGSIIIQVLADGVHSTCPYLTTKDSVAQNLILRKLQCVRTYVMGHDAYILQCGTVASLVAMETYTCLSWYSRI